jgi:hypothetical protein
MLMIHSVTEILDCAKALMNVLTTIIAIISEKIAIVGNTTLSSQYLRRDLNESK